MTTYHCTITATFDSHDADFALANFILWLTDPRHIEEGTVITTDDDPTNPDTIWHGLTLAAKASWVQAMQPEPPVTEGPPLTPEQLTAVRDQYLDIVRQNTERHTGGWDATLMVYEAIRINGERSPSTGTYTGCRWEILDELVDTTANIAETIGLTMPDWDDNPVWHDALRDQVESLLPAIESALEADLTERNTP